MGRTENSTRNMFTGAINQVLILIFRFVTRTVFIRCLGEEFLGINGLFSNILNLLSLADLGIGGALVYSLYKPISEKDEQKQIVIVSYLKKVYRNIGVAIMLIGIVLLPFLQYIIKDEVTIVNIKLVFLIYVFQTASTYLFFASRTEFVCAQQKRYVYNRISNIVTILTNIAQIIILILFKNFVLYLFTIIVFNIFQAFLVSRKVEKMYPYIKEKTDKALDKKEKKKIFKDCSSLMLYRINYVVLTATDNVILSKYIGLATVGIYSNYVLITNSFVNLLSTFFDSITASIGNLHVSKKKNDEYFIFRLINFLTAVFFGISAVGIYVLVNDFMVIWLGKEYVLSKIFVFVISINLYTEGIRKFLSTYRTSYGLFRQAKFMPIFGMLVNLIISIILVQKLGIIGVLLGTLISNVVSFLWYDPYLMHKKVFRKNVFNYYLNNLLYLILFVVIALICQIVCNFINISGILGFFIHGVITVLISLSILIVIFYKTEFGQYLKQLLLNIFNRKVGDKYVKN